MSKQIVVPAWMYHQEEAPSGELITNEARLAQVIADGWYDNPNFTRAETVAPPPVVEQPPTFMAEAADEIPPEPEILPPPEEPVVANKRDDLRDKMYPCPICKKEFGSNVAMLAHKRFHTAKNKKR